MKIKTSIAKLSRIRLRIIIFIILVIQLLAAGYYHFNYEASILAQLTLIKGSGFNSIHLVFIAYGHLIASLMLILILFFGYHTEIRQRVRLQASVEKAELTALKAQIQPHFLFNALNTIIYQIRENPDIASDTVRELADLYRYILQASNVEINSLDQELAFIKKYLAIEKSRFDDRLAFEIDVPQDWLKRDVPTLILQPLVENAVQHGLADKLQPGKIIITSDKSSSKETLLVMDNGIGLSQLDLGNIDQNPGVGIRNANERWSILTGNPLRIESLRHQGTRILLDW